MQKYLKKIDENNILKTPLLRNILILSTFIVLALTLYHILYTHPEFTKMLTDVARDDAISIARHLSSTLVSEKAELQTSLLKDYLLDEADKLKEMGDDFALIKLKVFSNSGEVIFSTDPGDIGKVNNERYFREIVARGEIYAEVVHKDTASLEGEKMSADVVETYVPLTRDDIFLGAVEIYHDITNEKEQLDTLLSRSSTTLFTLASGLFLVIIFTLVKENKTMVERRRAEDALRVSEERFRRTTDLLPTIVCETDNHLTITYMNKAGLENFGYSQADLERGIKVNDLIHPDDREKGVQHIDGLLHRANNVASERRMLRMDGSEMAVFVNLAPMNKDGKIVGMRASIADITELKNLQVRLLEAQKMEAIASLAGGIAHEFNNALGAVIPNINLLKLKLPDTEDVRKYVEPMYSSARRMADLTSQMLAYARGGKYLPEIKSLNNFVTETLPLIRHAVKPEIQIQTDLSDSVGNIEADLTQMQMILSAVVMNSVEATEGKGIIRIATRNEEIDSGVAGDQLDLKPGSYVSLTVEDDASGMSEETRARVFEPFFTTKFHGRGLGMAAVYGIINNHDGFISVDSELGKGTVVRIYLPESKSGDFTGSRVLPKT